MKFYLVLIACWFMEQPLISQRSYKAAQRTYNIEVSLKDSIVFFDYKVEFHETDTTDHAIYETSSLDTFLLLLKDDLSTIPFNKKKLLFYMHGMMGGQKLNLRYTKYDLVDKYITPESSNISRLISIRWPGNYPIYNIDKENTVKVAPALSNLLTSIISTVKESEEGAGTRFDIMNHSLGCELFKELTKHFPKTETNYFDQVLLCAPDLDIDVFTRTGPLLSFYDYCNRMTVYYSNKDLTLGFSREYNKKGRLGLDGPHLETVFHDQLYFVEMSQVMDEKLLPMRLTGHSYYRGSAIAAKDMLQTLIGIPADEIDGRIPSSSGAQFFIVPTPEN